MPASNNSCRRAFPTYPSIHRLFTDIQAAFKDTYLLICPRNGLFFFFFFFVIYPIITTICSLISVTLQIYFGRKPNRLTNHWIHWLDIYKNISLSYNYLSLFFFFNYMFFFVFISFCLSFLFISLLLLFFFFFQSLTELWKFKWYKWTDNNISVSDWFDDNCKTLTGGQRVRERCALIVYWLKNDNNKRKFQN